MRKAYKVAQDLHTCALYKDKVGKHWQPSATAKKRALDGARERRKQAPASHQPSASSSSSSAMPPGPAPVDVAMEEEPPDPEEQFLAAADNLPDEPAATDLPPVSPASPLPAAPRKRPRGPPIHYRLLPPLTLRRFIRPRVKLVGKRHLFGVPRRQIRNILFQDLPEGTELLLYPHVPDLPPPPRKPKRKRRMPAAIKAEIQEFHRKTAQLHRSSTPADSSTGPAGPSNDLADYWDELEAPDQVDPEEQYQQELQEDLIGGLSLEDDE